MGRVTFKQRYHDALRFLVRNTDMSWLDDDEPALTVEASVVAYIFDIEQHKVLADLRAARGPITELTLSDGTVIRMRDTP